MLRAFDVRRSTMRARKDQARREVPHAVLRVESGRSDLVDADVEPAMHELTKTLVGQLGDMICGLDVMVAERTGAMDSECLLRWYHDRGVGLPRI